MPWFWFCNVNDDEQVDQIIEKFNGRLFKDIPLKLRRHYRIKGQEEEDFHLAMPLVAQVAATLLTKATAVMR